ncbi:uncharacterized protein LOC123868799 isoform X2 [Maniola jurtina]|uniref:uncharacterized protein LOC123868799 isoform X2 n=1 Tax=Maniola jurtina TaxID=191418 RepID=UPI001E68DBBC|nr:uncharacterized protein LOC123868799 isoform X2 [Maniola jurtina]
MSPFRRILILSLVFATYQTAKLEEPDPAPPEPDRTSSFSRLSGSFLVKISMEKAECVNDKYKAENKSAASIPEILPSAPGLKRPEARSEIKGATKENPAISCYDIEETRISYINSSISDLPIKVRCDVDKMSTCLIVRNKIAESAIDSSAITLGEELWLSQTTFDAQSLYNKIEGITGTGNPQISHLLSTSVRVSQRIRYYYSAINGDGVPYNITTADDTKVKSLKALLWNDHLVGFEITKKMPMKFTVSGEPKPCWAEKKEWMCIDIIFETNSNNRLPVKDFYIEEVRIKSPGVPEPGVPDTSAPLPSKGASIQKLYFELTDLCFFLHNK